MPVLLFVLASLIGSALPEMHDLHLSKTLVNHNSQSGALEVSLHIFIDDLEMAMNDAGMHDLFLATTKEHPQADSLVSEYLNSVFSITANGQDVVLGFLGKEPSDDLMALWCYLESDSVERLDSVEISHRLFLDFFDDQKNIVTFVAGEEKEYFMLDEKKPKAEIDL